MIPRGGEVPRPFSCTPRGRRLRIEEGHGLQRPCVDLVPQSCLDARLPRITLQPIVENAILHGIARKSEPRGTVFISAVRSGGKVVVTVRDDGAGIAPGRLREILAPGGRAAGYGVHSVRERLHVLYGQEAELRIESQEGSGTKVSLILPEP